VAVSVAVNDVIRTGGFIAPGDRVDVLGVVSQEATGSAELILRDIAVLAVSNAVVGDAAGEARTGADNPRSLDTTVTLAVTPDEARRLVQVDEVGKLRLALRPRTSETTTD
jgi:pilus assembly protein CpaB